MKRLSAILLIALLMLNVMGYYGVFIGLQYQHKRTLTQRFDAGHYDESASVTIKIPIAIPYSAATEDFQRVDGEFEHDGEMYRLVKQRLSQDTLYMVCIKDHQANRIHHALKDYVKTFADQQDRGSSRVQTVSSLIKDYIASTHAIHTIANGWSQGVIKQSPSEIWIASYYASIVHPPDKA